MGYLPMTAYICTCGKRWDEPNLKTYELEIKECDECVATKDQRLAREKALRKAQTERSYSRKYQTQLERRRRERKAEKHV